MTRFAFVFNEDLPEVTPDGRRLDAVRVGDVTFFTGGIWTAERRRTEALRNLAIAEYLDSLKPKLPTEPGSVILATKIKGWVTDHDKTFLSLSILGEWRPLAAWNAKALSPLDIEDWKPVQLTVVEVSS